MDGAPATMPSSPSRMAIVSAPRVVEVRTPSTTEYPEVVMFVGAQSGRVSSSSCSATSRRAIFVSGKTMRHISPSRSRVKSGMSGARKHVLSAISSTLLVAGCAHGAATSPADRAAPPDSATGVPLTQVDPPPSVPPSVTLNGIEGVLIYKDWVSAGKSDRFRAADTISWPQTAAPSRADIVIRLSTQSRPFQARVLVFTERLPDSGVPDSAPDAVECSGESGAVSSRSGKQCHVELESGGSYRLLFHGFPTSARAIIANISWYVPTASRAGVQGAAPLDTIAIGWKF